MKFAAQSQAPEQDRRRYERVPVAIFGRCMFENKLEIPCQAINISPGDMAAISAHSPEIGEKVIIYLDNIGRVEGEVTRLFEGGFALEFQCTQRKREKLKAEIDWLKENVRFGNNDLRRHERITPRQQISDLRLEDGRSYEIEIIDISLSGAAVRSTVRPALGTVVSLGGMRGTVIRHFDEGIAIEFATVQTMRKIDRKFA